MSPRTFTPDSNYADRNSRAIAIAVGQTITVNTLYKALPEQLPNLSIAAVIAAGAANVPAVASTPHVLEILRQIWNTAISRTLLFSLATVCAAVPFTVGMEWLNAKEVAKSRKEAGRGEVLKNMGHINGEAVLKGTGTV